MMGFDQRHLELTREELAALAWLRKRRVSTRTHTFGKSVTSLDWSESPTSIITVSFSDLERRGYVERWPVYVSRKPGAEVSHYEWSACDQRPSFERPHWSCAVLDRGGVMLHMVVTVRVDPGHPDAIAHRLVFACEWADTWPDALEDLIRYAERLIEQAIALRSAGDPCECGGCEAP